MGPLPSRPLAPRQKRQEDLYWTRRQTMCEPLILLTFLKIYFHNNIFAFKKKKKKPYKNLTFGCTCESLCPLKISLKTSTTILKSICKGVRTCAFESPLNTSNF